MTVSVVEKEKVKAKPKDKGAADEVSEEADAEEEEEREEVETGAVEEITEMISEAKMWVDDLEKLIKIVNDKWAKIWVHGLKKLNKIGDRSQQSAKR